MPEDVLSREHTGVPLAFREEPPVSSESIAEMEKFALFFSVGLVVLPLPLLLRSLLSDIANSLLLWLPIDRRACILTLTNVNNVTQSTRYAQYVAGWPSHTYPRVL